jgi:ABC-type nitrate/sulfonate/bicarbonate transport system permease component
MRIVTDVLPSLGRLLAGYVIGCLAGTVIGVLLGISSRLRVAFEPIVHFLRSIPPPAMLPFGMLVLGVGDVMKILIIAFICLWPVVLGAIDGIKNADPLQIDTARVYKIPYGDILWRVLLPAAAPQIFAGMRISLALAIILMVISEMVSSTNGVGFFIIQAQSNFAITQMWAGILMLGLFGFCLNVLFNAIEAHVLRWHRGAKDSERN